MYSEKARLLQILIPLGARSLDWAFFAWSPLEVLMHAPVVTYTFKAKLAPFASALDALFDFEVKWKSTSTHVLSEVVDRDRHLLYL